MQVQRDFARAAIGDIADDGAAQCRAVDADLMGAAGARPKLEPSAAVMGAEHPILGHRVLALGVDDHVPAGSAGLLAQPGLDAALRRVGDADDDRTVGFPNLSLGEGAPEAAARLWAPSGHTAPRGPTARQ